MNETPTDLSSSPRRTPPVEQARWWTGIPFTLVLSAGCVLLALSQPATTYHFAPTMVAATWPIAQRLRPGRRLRPLRLGITSGCGAVIALGVTAILASVGALSGPTFFTQGALGETAAMVGAGVLIGLVVGLKPSARNTSDSSGRLPIGRDTDNLE